MHLFGIYFPQAGDAGPPLVFYDQAGIEKWFRTEYGRAWLKHNKIIGWFRKTFHYKKVEISLMPGQTVEDFLAIVSKEHGVQVEIFA